MRCLVIGCGFIGGHLIKALKEEGHYIIGVGTRSKESFNGDEYVAIDMRNNLNVEEIFNKVGHIDEVYLLAFVMGGATYINCGLNDADVMSDSALICINTIRACLKYNVGKIFFASSACVYPENDLGISTCKEDTVYPAFPVTEYGWTKIFIERLLMSFKKQHNMNIRIARLHSIVGEGSAWKGGREKAHSALAAKVAMVEHDGTIDVFGDGTQVRTFLHVSDCVNGIIRLMRSDCCEIINIGSDVPITIKEYIEVLKNISGKKFNVRYMPGPTGAHIRYCDIEKAKVLIDWYPTISIEDSTKRTYDWIVSRLK